MVETAVRKFVSPYFISNVQVLPASSRMPARVLVSSNHHLTYPNQVAVLDGRGAIVGEYWHAGHLLTVAQAELVGKGSIQVLLGGDDKTHRQATVVVLDPGKLTGVVKSSQEGPLQFINLPPAPPGLEKAVIR